MDDTMGNQQESNEISEVERAWLAGVLNGDGCFSLTLRVREGTAKCDLSVTLTQCDPALVLKATNILEKTGVMPGLVEYPPTGAGVRNKYSLRVTKMAHIAILIDLIAPYLAGEKQAQAGLMRKYVARRAVYADPKNRKGSNVLQDKEAVQLAARFYKLRGSAMPPEFVSVLNDYPAREYGQAPGSAQPLRN